MGAIKKLNKNSSRFYLESFAKEAGDAIGKDGLVLDAGAGDCRYKKYFMDATYESADFCQVDKPYAKVTYVCSLDEIPVEDCRYDLIFLSQVLEHIPNPEVVLEELNRVLKPNGKLWLSVPLYYEEHEQPYDYFRYTQFGLNHLLKNSGFEIEDISWLEGFYGTVAYQFQSMYRYLPTNSSSYGGGVFGWLNSKIVLLLKPFMMLLNFYFSQLDINHKYTKSGYCKNYTIKAKKAK